MTHPNPTSIATVDTNDLHGRAGFVDRVRHRVRDSGRALGALTTLSEVRTEEQVAFGTAVIRTAGATAIASLNARAVEQLASLQLALDSRVAGAIESASAAEDRSIVSSGALRIDELAKLNTLVDAGRLTEADASYAAERANARHAFRLERAARRADHLAEGFDQAATEALRRSGGVNT
jgi:hypothetical protein